MIYARYAACNFVLHMPSMGRNYYLSRPLTRNEVIFLPTTK